MLKCSVHIPLNFPLKLSELKILRYPLPVNSSDLYAP